MEALLFLVLVCAYQGLAIDIPKPHHIDLPAPQLETFETRDDANNITSHEIVSWTTVENDDPYDPVIGYKLKIWEVKKVKTLIHKYQDGEFFDVEEEIYPNMDRNVIPDGIPVEIATPAGVTTATFHGMKVDVNYQFAVLAFTAKGEGRLSNPARIMLHPNGDTKKEW